MEDLDWQIQKQCVDVGEYELTIERQKTEWECEQKSKTWKWSVDYHGSITASGVSHSEEDAKKAAVHSVPSN